MALRTEFEFVLPRGYLDDDGEVHRRGVMRLATARDELEPLRSATVTGPDDPRVDHPGSRTGHPERSAPWS